MTNKWWTKECQWYYFNPFTLRWTASSTKVKFKRGERVVFKMWIQCQAQVSWRVFVFFVEIWRLKDRSVGFLLIKKMFLIDLKNRPVKVIMCLFFGVLGVGVVGGWWWCGVGGFLPKNLQVNEVILYNITTFGN